MSRAVSPTGLTLIRTFEGFSARIYRCPAGKPTIGYGHVVQPGESFPGDITGRQAEVLLRADLRPVEQYLDQELPSLTSPQFDALCSFIYNVGIAAFQQSTLLSLIKTNRPIEAAKQFDLWIYSGRRALPGLVRRRKAEKALFLAGTES